jgi:hypothetical protein
MRDYTILRHVFEPSSRHCNFGASQDKTGVRINILNYAIFIVVVFYTGRLKFVVNPRLNYVLFDNLSSNRSRVGVINFHSHVSFGLEFDFNISASFNIERAAICM